MPSRIERYRDCNPSPARSEFDCGKPGLNDWLRRSAGQMDRKDSTRLFVVCDDERRVVAYYALSALSVDPDRAPVPVRKGMPSRYTIPGVLLTRLATDWRHQGQGIGTALLRDAVRRVVQVAEDIAFKVMFIDALDDEAFDFYLRRGWMDTESDEDPYQVYLAIRELREAVKQAATES